MADIELVIKISEEEYEYCKTWELMSPIAKAIVKGTPLPKGHGELKDVDEIWRLYDHTDIDYTMIDALNDAPAIIEADGGE